MSTIEGRPLGRRWGIGGDQLGELNGVRGAADDVAEAEVTSVSGGALVDGDVGVDEEVDVHRHQDAVFVHLRSPLQVGVADGDLRPR